MPNKLILMRQNMQNITLTHCQTERFIKHLIERWWSKCIYIEGVIPKHRAVDMEFKDLTKCYKGHVINGFMNICKDVPE